MAPSLPREIVARIKEETDIVDVVRRYVTLSAAGSAFKGLCPFHREKTPSFHVNPARQIYKCFGCGEGGDVLSFLMKVEGLSFPEALETLARPLDIDLSRYLADEEAEGERLAFHRALETAAALWSEALAGDRGAAAREYLAGRGFRPETWRRFELGYAPGGSEWFTGELSRRGVSADLALRAGLMMRKGQEPPFAYFRNRLIFPIRNIAQRVSGFGGRVLGPGEPKYLNSPDSVYFNKGKLLYGFSSSRIAVARAKSAVLVEGYLDLIAMAQAGFGNVVATCGTAFTTEQARLLRRGCGTVYLLFDGDRAGVAAAVKGCHAALAAGLEPKVGRLPPSEDPASFLQGREPAELAQVLEQGLGYFPFLLALVDERGGGRLGKERALRQALRSLALVPDPIRQAYLLQEAAELFGIGLGVLERQLQQEAKAAGRAAGGAAGERAGAAAPGPGEPAAGTALAGESTRGGGPDGPPAGASGRLDRGRIEDAVLAHVLRDDTGRAAALYLQLRGERACAGPLAERLRRDLAAWEQDRADGGEQSPAAFVQSVWHDGPDEYRAYVTGLLASELVPERGDFLKAVRDGHERLERDEELEGRRRAARGAADAERPPAGGRP